MLVGEPFPQEVESRALLGDQTNVKNSKLKWPTQTKELKMPDSRTVLGVFLSFTLH